MDQELIPNIPFADWVNTVVNWLQANVQPLFTFIEMMVNRSYDWLFSVLTAPGAIGIAVIATAIAWFVRSWKFALFTLLAFLLLPALDLWEAAMATFAQVLVATVVAIVLSVPFGVIAARSNAFSAALRPVLDFMQTFPPFTYLIPAVIFFGIGVPAGMVATVVFALPPGARLTELGIRQVDKEMVEAGEAFGARPSQILGRIQVPLAMPSIMAGINQIIMLALSMVVLAGIVGAPGLGAEIVEAVQLIEIGAGAAAGVAVVVVAIFLDRVTAAFGSHQGSARRRISAIAGLVRHRNSRSGDRDSAAPTVSAGT